MDRKSIIILVVCFVLFILWSIYVQKFYPPRPHQPAATNVVTQTQSGAGMAGTNLVPAEAQFKAAVLPAQPPAPARPELPEELVVLTNENARYTFTSHGGGLKLVELLHYPESVVASRRKTPEGMRLASLNTRAPLPVLALLGDASWQEDGIFSLTKTANGVRIEKLLTNGLRLVKQFQLSTNYLVFTRVWLENTSSNDLNLAAQEWVIGTATPMGPDDDGSAVGMMWYNGVRSEDVTAGWFANKTLGCFPGTPRQVYVAGQSNVVWAAVHNQFFTLAAMLPTPAMGVVARQIELPRQPDADPRYQSGPAPKGYATTLVFPATTLAPGQKLEREVFFFAGPKEYRTLARVATQFGNNVDAIMGYGGFFGFFSKVLLLMMNWFHDVFKLGYGWAIIAITVIIKVLFWPLTQASTRSMKRMAALQPQMKAIQEKYKDDPAKMNKKLMEFMKENKVSPLGGCLPMLLQMPVFIGFFYMIRSAIELRGARFLWVQDLSKPDTLFIIPGLDLPFNLLPLIMGATMLWQSHMTPPSPGMDPVQQKLMRYMPLIFLFLLYGFASGLTLYWTVQNLLTIAQMKLTKTQEVAPVKAAPAQPTVKKKK